MDHTDGCKMTDGEQPAAPSSPLVAGLASDEIERPPWRKLAVLALVAGGLLAIVYGSPARSYLGHLQELSAQIRSLGLLAPLALVIGTTVLVAAGFPRLLFCVIAGMALGFWQGLLWAQTGTLLGSYLTFLAARAWGGDWLQRWIRKRPGFHRLAPKEGLSGIILARQLPVPGLTVNLGCGLLGMRHRDFLIGTTLGQLPEAIPCTLIGAGALEASFAKSTEIISLAVVLGVLLWMGMRALPRRPSAGARDRRV